MERLFDRPLFIGAHVDDVELFSGATIHRFRKNAHVLAFSKHLGICLAPLHEFKDSMKELGVSHIECQDFMACQNGIESFTYKRQEIANILLAYYRLGPSVVVTHQSTDTNQDHKAVHDEVLRVFKGQCPILCGTFSANDVPMADRRLFVEVSLENIHQKVRALNCYASQRRGYRGYLSKDGVSAEAKFYGNKIGCEYAEAFEVIQLEVRL